MFPVGLFIDLMGLLYFLLIFGSEAAVVEIDLGDWKNFKGFVRKVVYYDTSYSIQQ